MLSEIVRITRPLRYRWDAFTYSRKGGAELESLRGTCAGRALLIVGNGPSLNQTPLDRFCGVTSIGMNKIDLLFDRVQWRPSLILCVNNLVVKQHAERFAASEVPVFVSWKARHFMRREHARRLRYFLSLDSSVFSKDIPAGVGWGSTVTYAALQFAYYMEANPVIIVGVDHSFTVDGHGKGIEKRSGPDANHFDPNYFKAGTYWGLPDLAGSEQAYRTARREFDAVGRQIYDATIGGRLTVFPKVSIDEAVRLARAAGAHGRR